MEINITSTTQTISKTEVQSITLPGMEGEIQILEGHAETFAQLREGQVKIEFRDKKKEILTIGCGECHIQNNVVDIIL